MAPPPNSQPTASTPAATLSGMEFNLLKVAYTLRVILLVAGVMAPIIMASGSQTPFFKIPSSPNPVAFPYKYSYSSAYIYLVAVLTMTCLYALGTASVSYLSLSKPALAPGFLFRMVLSEMFMWWLVTSATGARAAMRMVSSSGDSHIGWMQMCKSYGKFCWHVEIAVFVSLAASIILAVILVISTYMLYRKALRPA